VSLADDLVGEVMTLEIAGNCRSVAAADSAFEKIIALASNEKMSLSY
jgi:hypothetical protein